jgi:hypothetical protein
MKGVSRSVAQPGSASALGAEGRGFKSCRSDHLSEHSAPTWFFPKIGIPEIIRFSGFPNSSFAKIFRPIWTY